MHSSTETPVLRDATTQQLEQAVAMNHRALFQWNTLCGGGSVETREGLTWTGSGPAKNDAMIAFPALTEANAGPLLDEMMDWYRAHPPKGAGCWSLNPPQPADLGIRLLARGFQPGWQPNWMALDLEAMKENHAVPAGLHISADNDTGTQDIKGLPYGGDNGAVSMALLKAHPELAQRFIATLDGKIVGHSCVLMAAGVAGLYNVGVLEKARMQGIGKAVVLAACRYAKEKGYRYAVLNGTGRRMYEQVGFRHISNGFTWWLMNDRFITNPPSPALVALAEAVGRGDIAALNATANTLNAEVLNTPLNNGMTLLQLAIHCKQTAAAEWLIQQGGAAYTARDAWDLGWKDRAAALLAANPQEVNRRYDHWQYSLLHVAAERYDIALAQLALSARPDLTIEDSVYHGTALGWAIHLHRPAIAELIKAYSASL